MTDADIFNIFSQVTKRTAISPIPVVAPSRKEEIMKENIDRLRNNVSSNEQIIVQTNFDTPRTQTIHRYDSREQENLGSQTTHAFPNSRTREEKEDFAEGKAAANPYSQARHPSPHTPLPDRPKKIDLSAIFMK